MESKECAEYEIRITEKCGRKYGKAAKRMNPGLRGIIESELNSLRHDPDLGSNLEWNLDPAIHPYRQVFLPDSMQNGSLPMRGNNHSNKPPRPHV